MSAKVLTMLPPPANSTYPTNSSSSSFFDMQESSHNPFNLSSASSTANSTTLFIGNLSLYCTEREIFQAFLPFGPIDSIHLKRFNDSKKISYGFVKFQERQAAEEALKTLNDQILLGRPMRLGWANELTSQGIVADFGSLRVTPPPSAQVHVTFTAMSATPVTESLLREAFEKQGAEVRDVTIKKLQYNRFTNQQTGYGFVHFPLTQQGILSAMRAVEAVNGSVVGNVALQCQLSHGLLSLLHQHQRPSSPPQPLVRHSPPQQFLPSPPSATPSPTLLNHRNTQPQSLASPPHSSQSFRLDLSSSSSDSYHRAARFQQPSGRSQHGPYSSPTTAIASSSSSSLSGHYFQPQQQSHLFETQALPSLLSSRSSSSSSENFQFPFLN